MGFLPDQVHEEILVLSEQGNLLMEKGRYPDAVEAFTAALVKLPEPVEQWEAFVWLKASIGDALFFMQDYSRALSEFFEAANGPDGAQNAFVILRLGECLYEQENSDALDYLCKAYFLEGVDIFRGQDKKYFSAVESVLGMA